MSELTVADAARILNSAAGFRLAAQAAPSARLVLEATAIMEAVGLMDYCRAVLDSGASLVRAGGNETPEAYKLRLAHRADHDVDGWWRGVVSSKPQKVRPGITQAFIQRAGGTPGIEVPASARADRPVVDAEGRLRVLERATGQPVIPRVIRHGRANPLLRVDGTADDFVHVLTIEQSAWQLVGGWHIGAAALPRAARPRGNEGTQPLLQPQLPLSIVK